MRHYLALCVSRDPVDWPLGNLPFYNYRDPTVFPRTRSRERIDWLAEAWNRCHTLGLESYPDATHILNTGSYYVTQTAATQRLIQRYEELDSEIVLAGNVWAVMNDRLFTTTRRTYDFWAFPDLKGWEYYLRPPDDGLIQVSSVGMPCIYPVQTWRDHPFHNPESMDDGIWYNQFCRESGLAVFCDLSIRFYRTKHDSDIREVSIRHRIHRELVLARRLVGRPTS